MSTFIPSLTDSIPQLEQYKPNIGFFQQQLQRKSQQYEQGYSQVKSAYDSILNAPLSDEANVATRETYLKQAQDNLKNLSSVDLSNQSNVDQANNVFAPFWQDQFLLKDATFTKSIQGEMARGMQLRDSKDKDQRDQYSEVAMQYLANGLDKLKTAGRSEDVYNKLEKRRFVPFVNEKEYWNKQADLLKFEINWSDPSGPYLINTKNGQRAEQSFRSFAEGMVSPQMEDMYRVIGTVEKEARVKQIKSRFPGTTDDQALGLIGQDVLKDVRGNYTKAITGLSDEYQTSQTKLEEFQKSLGDKPTTPDQENKIKDLRDYQTLLKDQLSKKQKEYDDIKNDNSQNAIDVHNNIVSNPDYYFSKLAKQRSVNNWATAAASNQSRKVEINPVWKEQNDVFYKQEDLKLKNRELTDKELQFEFDKTHDKKYVGKGTGDGSSAGGTIDAEGNYIPSKDEQERGIVLGAGSTDVTQVGSALDLFNKRQQERLATADDAVYSMEGLGRIITNLPGVSQQDVVTLFSNIKRIKLDKLANPDSTDGNVDKETQESYQKISKALREKTGVNITGPNSIREGIIAYAKQYFDDKSKDGGSTLTPDDIGSLIKYNAGATAQTEYLALETKKKELFQKNLMASTDPKINKMTVIRSDGKKDLVNSSDLAKDISNLAVIDVHGKRVNFSANEIAKAFIDNKIQNNIHASGVVGNGDYAGTIQIGNRMVDLTFGEYDKISKTESKLKSKYGDPKEFNRAVTKFAAETIPNLPEYNNQTGKMGVDFLYGMDGKVTKGGTERATRIVQEITQAGNRDGIYIDGELSKDTNKIDAITAIGSLGEKELEKYFSAVKYKTVGINGTPSVQLTLSPEKSNSKEKIAGTNISDLGDIKTIEIPIAPNAQGSTLNSLPKNEGSYIYQSILRGKTMKSDPIMTAAGFDYTIQPDDTRNPTKAYVTINRKLFNKDTGKYETKPTTGTIDFFGANKKTPDELVGELYNMFQVHLTENKVNQAQYQSNPNIKKGRNFQDIMNKVGEQ